MAVNIMVSRIAVMNNGRYGSYGRYGTPLGSGCSMIN